MNQENTKVDDYYHIIGEGEKTFLEIMDNIAGGEFEFNPPRLSMQIHTVDFD